jgi:uncharacterized protein
MTWNPNLEPGSTLVVLTGLKEGTHPLVLHGGDAVLVVDPERELRAYRFEGSLVWSYGDRRVRGSLTGNLVSACDRCLAPFEREHSFEVDAKVRVSDAASSEQGGVDAENEIRVSPEQESLDLADAFRTAVLLEQPIKNVCREECRGLCPVCGVDLNRSMCDCDTTRGDPRWDALKDLSWKSDPKES